MLQPPVRLQAYAALFWRWLLVYAYENPEHHPPPDHGARPQRVGGGGGGGGGGDISTECDKIKAADTYARIDMCN